MPDARAPLGLVTRGQRRALRLAAGVLLAAVTLAMLAGPVWQGPGALLSAFFAGPAAEGAAGGAPELQLAHQLVWHTRLPRTLAAALVGACLALAGTVFQGMFRNPLADPSLVGVSAGASLGVALSALAPTASAGSLAWLASLSPLSGGFVGAVVVTAVVLGIAQARGEGPTQRADLLLVGVAITAIVGALTAVVLAVLPPDRLRQVTFFTLGSLTGVTWAAAGLLLVVTAVVFAWAMVHHRAYDTLALGAQAARHAGLDAARLERRSLVLAALGVAAAVSTAGLVGFVGLIAPHLWRLRVGPHHRHVIPGAMLLGAVLTVCADAAGRTGFGAGELPLGVFTALVGGPYFLWLLMRPGGAR